MVPPYSDLSLRNMVSEIQLWICSTSVNIVKFAFQVHMLTNLSNNLIFIHRNQRACSCLQKQLSFPLPPSQHLLHLPGT